MADQEILLRNYHCLRRRRTELSLSQHDLALRLRHRGVMLSAHAISDLERGKRGLDLSQSVIVALSDALRWSIDELMVAIASSTTPHNA